MLTSRKQFEAEAARMTPVDSSPKRDLRAICSVSQRSAWGATTQREAQSKYRALLLLNGVHVEAINAKSRALAESICETQRATARDPAFDTGRTAKGAFNGQCIKRAFRLHKKKEQP